MTRRSRAQGSIYRRRAKDGKPEPVWTISYRVGGRRVTERAYADRVASEQLAARTGDRAAWRDRAFVLAMNGDTSGAEKIAETM